MATSNDVPDAESQQSYWTYYEACPARAALLPAGVASHPRQHADADSQRDEADHQTCRDVSGSGKANSEDEQDEGEPNDSVR